VSGLVDALAHLDDQRIEEPTAVLLERAATAGVAHVVNAGVDPLADADALPSAQGVRVWRAFGVHPLACGDRLDDKLAALERRLASVDVVAVGECGLDQRAGMPPVDAQQRALARQLTLARERELPVILHVVSATAPLLDVLADAPGVRGFVHGFTGAPEVAEQLLGLGLHLSFGGQVANPKAKRCRRSAAAVPLDRLLVESDTPDHPPNPPDGRLSEPARLPDVVAALAGARGESVDVVGPATARNARALLKIPG
jgi:TatD DNase family protein